MLHMGCASLLRPAPHATACKQVRATVTSTWAPGQRSPQVLPSVNPRFLCERNRGCSKAHSSSSTGQHATGQSQGTSPLPGSSNGSLNAVKPQVVASSDSNGSIGAMPTGAMPTTPVPPPPPATAATGTIFSLKPVYVLLFGFIFVGGLLFASMSLQLTSNMGFQDALTKVVRRIFRSIAFRQLVVIAVAIFLVRFALNNVLKFLARWSSSPVQWDKSRVYYVMKEVSVVDHNLHNLLCCMVGGLVHT